MECERSAEGVQEFARRRRIVIILGDYRKIGDRQRDRRSVQDQQDQRKNERQRSLPSVSNYLSQFFTGLRNYAFHFFSFQFSVFSFQFSVFSFQFSVFSFQFSVFSFQFSVFSFQFSVVG